MKAHLYRILLVLYGSIVLASGAIVPWPEPSGRPLLGRNDWQISGQAFDDYTPTDDEVAATSPPRIFFRFYTPKLGITAGDVTTKPFLTPPFLSVPVTGAGISKEGNNQLYIECLATHESRPILSADTIGRVVEAILAIPAEFCAKEIRLIAHGGGTRLLGVGTPSSVSLLTFLKSKGVGMVFPHAVLFTLIGCYLFGGVLLLRRFISAEGVPLLAILLGFTGYLEFFLYNLSPMLGGITSILLPSAGLAILVDAFRSRREWLANTWNELMPFFRVWFLGSLTYVAILYYIDNGGGAWFANYRFYPAAWSSDNQLASITGEALWRGIPLHGLFGAEWQVSDRPPVLAGLAVFARPYIYLLAGLDDGAHFVDRYYSIQEIICVCFWIPAVLYCISLFSTLSSRARLAILFFISITPFAIFNSIYTWPKLLGAAFGVLGCCVYVHQRPGNRDTDEIPSWVYLACFTALSMLTHGSDFIFLGLFWVLVVGLPRGGWLRLVKGVALIALLLAKWWAWQRFVDPPGNALLKYALAGVTGFDEKHVGLITTVVREYSELTLSAWLDEKLRYLSFLVGTVSGNSLDHIGDASYKSTIGLAEKLRTRDFFVVTQSLAGAFLCAIISGWLFVRHPGRFGATIHSDLRACLLFIGLAVLSYFLTPLVFRIAPLVIHLSFSAHLALLFAAPLLLATVSWRSFCWVLALQVAYSLVVWLIDPILRANYTDWLMIALTLCVIGIAAFSMVLIPIGIGKNRMAEAK